MTAGRGYQGVPSSLILGVSEYTRPVSSSSVFVRFVASEMRASGRSTR